MAKFSSLRFSFIYSIALFLGTTICCCQANGEERKVYIAYMGALPGGKHFSPSHHFGMLQEVVDESFVQRSLVRSYTRSFNGFAANLTDQEVEKLASMEGVLSVLPSRAYHLHTTRSWDFMGFPESVQRNPAGESDVIIGVIDSGIWPESESFHDEGLGPPPMKWKGGCHGGENFTCNNKIIGARYYYNATFDDHFKPTARDSYGHGTFLASTAAGGSVPNANFYDIANGTARGAVPSARIAVYRVCEDTGYCLGTSILAAFDDAIADGVDIIITALGAAPIPLNISDDVVAIGAFHAMERGVLTVQSGGNNGPDSDDPGKVSSIAPWLFTVAASSIDRDIENEVVLGNGMQISGNAVNVFQMESNFTLYDGDDCAFLSNETEAKGKILLCFERSNILTAIKAGAAGAIYYMRDVYEDSFVTPIPASGLFGSDFTVVRLYTNLSTLPLASIKRSISYIGSGWAIAATSSKGPSMRIPDILKPDITAPGIGILAAFSPLGSPSDYYDTDKRSVNFTIMSGTSVAAAHVAGAAAYVKSFHPGWSPCAIKSALMTTSWLLNATNAPLAELDCGAGHIDPVAATNAGLVYETSKEDYLKITCGMLLLPEEVAKLRKMFGNISCPERADAGYAREINYPTIAVQVNDPAPFTYRFPRTVTNVGLPNSTYTAEITRNSYSFGPPIHVSVEPSTLSFRALNEKKSFVVTVSGEGFQNDAENARYVSSASLIWADGIHYVRSNVVVFTPFPLDD